MTYIKTLKEMLIYDSIRMGGKYCEAPNDCDGDKMCGGCWRELRQHIKANKEREKLTDTYWRKKFSLSVELISRRGKKFMSVKKFRAHYLKPNRV